jgi:hypothetical protein
MSGKSPLQARPVPPGKRGVSRSSRNAGWDAVDATAAQDERCRSRTAKPCGPDASMAGVKLAKASFRWRRRQQSPILRGEHGISRRAIAQGRPDVPAEPVCSCAVSLNAFAHETAGAARTRSSLRPLFFGGASFRHDSGKSRRENADAYLLFEIRIGVHVVIARSQRVARMRAR